MISSEFNLFTYPFVDMAKAKFEVERAFDDSVLERCAFRGHYWKEVFGATILLLVEVDEGSP